MDKFKWDRTLLKQSFLDKKNIMASSNKNWPINKLDLMKVNGSNDWKRRIRLIGDRTISL